MKKIFISSIFLLLLATNEVLIGSLSNLQKINAQQSEDKCEDFLSKYARIYKECFSREIIDEFAPKKFDEFGVINLEDEWARLDGFAASFRNSSEPQIYIVAYGGKVNKIGELKERTNRLIYYLTQNRRIESKKITIINGGFREKFEFELWLSPSEKIFPPLSPTIDPERVKFRGKMKPLPLDLGP